jgi:ubiquinone/menaquinone biosynthesis C-methylase UbiE
VLYVYCSYDTRSIWDLEQIMFAQFVARQLSHPSGLAGRWILGPLWNRRNRSLNDAALEALKLRSDDRVLEVGFGGGYLLGRMTAIVTSGFIGGVDISAAMVEQGQARYRPLIQAGKMDLKVGTADRLPYPAAQFNKAVSVNSIFYWQDVPQSISELSRVLYDNGRLVLCFTDKASLQQKDFASHGLKLYDTHEVEQLLTAAGLHTINVTRQTDRHRAFWCMTAQKTREGEE